MRKIKDPLYGYIELDDYIADIIDTPNFQRLRHIIQTSYTAIYPSALHNRFSHSLGVYHLGKIAFDSLFKNSQTSISETKQKQLKKTFLTACILHDLGHAPFSHTGESFYFENKNDSTPKIWTDLRNKLNNAEFNSDVNGDVIGKEHEIMSALLGIKIFNNIIKRSDRVFFVRCIIGAKHKNITDDFHKIENALIELLNSEIIDVDKLDYIVRDSYMSGYNSINIDYTRLLNSVFISDKKSYICYGKHALSVLESVITAHDMERKWIQIHPIILYEAYLIRTIIRELNGKLNSNNNYLFSYGSLTESGLEFEYSLNSSNNSKKPVNRKISIRLLSDYDILYLAKNVLKTQSVDEFFNRQKRMHPIWKSEAEYKYLYYKISDKQKSTFINLLKSVEDDIITNKYGTWKIDDSLLLAYEQELQNINSELDNCISTSQKSTYDKKLKVQKNKIKLLKKLKELSNDNNIDFDFIVITQKQFKSNLSKDQFKELQIKFGNSSNDTENLDCFIKISDQEIIDDQFFYLYYYRKCEKVEPFAFVQQLQGFAIEL